MADADTIINITKADFSDKSVPNQSSLKDFQFAIKKVSGEQKTFLETLHNTLNDFFSNEKFKPTSEKQLAEAANKLYNNIVKNLDEAISSISSKKTEDPDLSTINVGDFSKIVISDSPKKANLEQYLKDELEKIKKDSGTNEKIDNVTFTEKELEDFKKKVIAKVDEIVSEEVKKYNDEMKKEVPETDVASLWNESEFYKRHKEEIENQICLPVIDFLNIEKKVVNSLKEKIAKIKETVNASNVKKNGVTPLLIRGTSISNLFKKKKADLPLSFAETFTKVNKFWLKHPLRQVKKTIRDWGKKFAKDVAGALNYFLPITEVLFIGKIVSKIVSFSFSLAKGLTYVLSNAWKFTRALFKNTIGRLLSVFKKLKESSFTKVTTKIFKSFFQSYIGAYILGYAVGFFYKVFKNFLPSIKERWQKFLEYVKPVLETIEEIGKKIAEFASAAWFTIDDIVKELNYYNRTEEDKSILGAIEFLNENARDSNGRLLKRNGEKDIFEKINTACDWIQNNFTVKNLGKLFDILKHSAANMALDWLAAGIGAKIGAVLGGALAGPFGAVAGGVIGSFVGGGIRKFLYGEKRKLSSKENVYQQYLRTKYNRATVYSSAERHSQTDTGEYDTTKKFGFVLDILKRGRLKAEQGEKLQLTQEELRRISAIDIGLKEKLVGDDGFLREDLPEEFEYLSNLSEDNIIAEIDSSIENLQLLDQKAHYFRTEKASFDYRNFASDDDSTEARKSFLALNSDGTYQFPRFANNFTDRAVLLHRIYRATVLRNMLHKIMLDQMSPNEFIETYRKLDKVTPENYNQVKINESKQDFRNGIANQFIDLETIDTLNKMGDTHETTSSKLLHWVVDTDKFVKIHKQQGNIDALNLKFHEAGEQAQLKLNESAKMSRTNASLPELQVEEDTFAKETLESYQAIEDLVDGIEENIHKINFDPSLTMVVSSPRNQPPQQVYSPGPLADSGQIQLSY